jgi:hypothetical protein
VKCTTNHPIMYDFIIHQPSFCSTSTKNLNILIFKMFLLKQHIGDTHFDITRSASSVLAPLFLGSYSVTIGRKVVAWGQKKK